MYLRTMQSLRAFEMIAQLFFKIYVFETGLKFDGCVPGVL